MRRSWPRRTKIEYAPTWTANRNNTTDTVAKFFKPAADAWDGANGVSVTWPDSDFSQETKDCNAAATKGGIFSYTPDENAYAAYGQYCIMMDLIAAGHQRRVRRPHPAGVPQVDDRDRHHPQQLGTGRHLGRGQDRRRRLRLRGEVLEERRTTATGGSCPVGGKAKAVKVAAPTSKSSSTK